MMFSTNEKVYQTYVRNITQKYDKFPIYFDVIPYICLGRRQIKKKSGKRQIKSKQIEIQK